MNDPLLAIVANHLWQSTLFAMGIAALAWLLRRHGARVRHMLWLAASLKFLLPFALLAAVGTQIPWESPDAPLQSPVLSAAGVIAAPMAGEIAFPVPRPDDAVAMRSIQETVALILWALGAGFVVIRRLRQWAQVRRALRASVIMPGIDFPVPVRCTKQQFEPGIVGIFRPVLLLPEGITDRLTAVQLRAVLAHERCHLRWHDNLTASLHMRVEALFWFFPPVWWIGTRLLAEREQACDEQVAREGHVPEQYAEGILAVCEHYIASRLPSVSGVSGADLRKRIEGILRNTLALRLDKPKKLLLAAVGCSAIAIPLAAGMVSGNAGHMLLSLGPSTLAMQEYWQLSSASARSSSDAMSDLSASTCPGPSAEVIRRQRVLASRVAGLTPRDRDRALLYAVASNSETDVRRLLATNAPRKGDGLLIGDSLMQVAARFSDVKILELLANADVAIDVEEYSGIVQGNLEKGTPLMIAIAAGRMDNVRWLVEHGANVNARAMAVTPLIRAMVSCRDAQLVAQLIRAGARPNEKAIRIARNLGFNLNADAAAEPVSDPLAAGSLVAAIDLDGDSREDQVATLADRAGLFARLSSRGSAEWIKVTDALLAEPGSGPGLKAEIAAPGRYRTACDKGYGARCTTSEPALVTLQHAGIRLFQEEGASSLVYWDAATGRFDRVWLTD